MSTENREINKALLGISRRAESVDRQILVETFVDVGPLLAVLSSRDHQIVYGRRGTGKTHALIYLVEQDRSRGSASIYLDLRNIGSSGGLYGDPFIPVAQRATRLALDVIGAVHDEVLRVAIESSLELSVLGPALDELASSATEIEILGETRTELASKATQSTDSSFGASLAGSVNPELSLSSSSSRASGHSDESKMSRSGSAQYRLHFGQVSGALARVVAALSPASLLIVLDEWSTIPLELQPYLADLIRRAILPIKGITVKIAAIEQRTSFSIGTGSTYVGIEVGSDASADIDLDDYMVFDNNEERAVQFFKELVFSHYKSDESAASVSTHKPHFVNSNQLVQAAFTQQNAFDDFVKAAEGVPRDAFNVLSLAAQGAIDEKISIPIIRVAARTWYQRDKETAIKANSEAQDLLNWIIDQVIGHRRARAFLLRSNTRHQLIDTLFDARLLHLLKKSISGQDEPGARYDAYKLDYGCYVDMLATKASPSNLFPSGDESRGTDIGAARILVPDDDYRAIRRAILDLTTFENRFSR